MNYREHFSIRKVSQSETIPGKEMVRNNAGGCTFKVDVWKKLHRFLILGSEGGTYYVSEKKLTVDNAKTALSCIEEDGLRVIDMVLDISESGKAPKNDPALFVLAMCSSAADEKVRKKALEVLPRVARIGTHLFHFAEYVEGFRGWGRSLRRAVVNWYLDKSVDDLSYQLIKYQSRDGWSHKDLLRLSHPKTKEEEKNNVFRWVTKGDVPLIELPLLIYAHEKAKKATTSEEIISLIEKYNLPWEAIPTQWLKNADVWISLLPKLPLTATIRNLGRMSSLGILNPLMAGEELVIKKLNKEYIHKSRLHPLSILIALKTYKRGHGLKGNLTWTPNGRIVDALDEAFYLAFDNVEVSGKRIMFALDVSGSMSWCTIAGLPITPKEASAAMALISAKVEPNYMTFAFSNEFVPVDISPRQRLDDVIRKMEEIGFGDTDCALPMIYALKNKIPVDVFVVYTDNETWAGEIHPVQALNE